MKDKRLSTLGVQVDLLLERNVNLVPMNPLDGDIANPLQVAAGGLPGRYEEILEAHRETTLRYEPC